MSEIKKEEDRRKRYVSIFLPAMIELEAMGRNPVEVMFGNTPLTMDVIEDCSRALHRAKKKYPEWYKVVGKWIAKRMKGK